MDFESLKNKFEDQIRAGQIAEAQRELEKLAPSSILREQVAAFADIARRVRSEVWGLRVLRPIVRSEAPVFPKVSEHELCAYAGLLIKVGALPEAEGILQNLDSEKIVNVNTFLSQIHIAQWDYETARKELKKIIARQDVAAYQRCVAEVNLASAYIFLEQHAPAKTLLRKILEKCKENNWDLLYGNALELSAQLAVFQQDWAQALGLLKQSEQRAGQHTRYLIFIEKWKALVHLLQTKPGTPESNAALAKVEDVLQKAKTLRSWETVRDLDFYVAVYLNHQNLLMNVYFGTPHASYRKRIEKICKKQGWVIPQFYFRKLSSAPALRVLDLASGSEEGVSLVQPLKPGQMLHRFLNILAMDFYKPMGIGELFSKLFTGEYYNPDSSGERISQAVKQLRKWFEVNEIPLKIEVENETYMIKPEGAYAFKVLKASFLLKDVSDLGFEQQLKSLKENWPYKSFSTAQASLFLNISNSSARALLQKALKKNLIYHSGSARSTLYRFEK